MIHLSFFPLSDLHSCAAHMHACTSTHVCTHTGTGLTHKARPSLAEWRSRFPFLKCPLSHACAVSYVSAVGKARTASRAFSAGRSPCTSICTLRILRSFENLRKYSWRICLLHNGGFLGYNILNPKIIPKQHPTSEYKCMKQLQTRGKGGTNSNALTMEKSIPHAQQRLDGPDRTSQETADLSNTAAKRPSRHSAVPCVLGPRERPQGRPGVGSQNWHPCLPKDKGCIQYLFQSP